MITSKEFISINWEINEKIMLIIRDIFIKKKLYFVQFLQKMLYIWKYIKEKTH